MAKWRQIWLYCLVVKSAKHQLRAQTRILGVEGKRTGHEITATVMLLSLWQDKTDIPMSIVKIYPSKVV